MQRLACQLGLRGRRGGVSWVARVVDVRRGARGAAACCVQSPPAHLARVCRRLGLEADNHFAGAFAVERVNHKGD
jgi:hypothetical protein